MANSEFQAASQRNFSVQRSAFCVAALMLLTGAPVFAQIEVNAAVSALRLKARVVVRGTQATLADVLSFEHADPALLEEIGSKPIGPAATPPTTQSVTHEQVSRRLNELNVNLSRVLLSGSSSCSIAFETLAVEKPAHGGNVMLASDETVAPLIRSSSAGAAAGATLADQIRKLLSAEFGDRGTLDIEFEAAGQEFLELSSPPFEFVVRAGRPQTLGVREMTVTIRRDGRSQRTVRIGANLKLLRSVLVAAKPLNAGSPLKRDAIETAQRVFTDLSDLGLDNVDSVVGQQVGAFVAPGQMLRAKDIKQVDLVRRSQPVTVEGGSTVSLRVTGIALDSGKLGDSVRVRLGEGRAQRREVRGVVTGVATVRLAEEVP
jgi:flagella basal body P-ring formation protein FlgA